MDADDVSVFDRTVAWAVGEGPSRPRRFTFSPHIPAPRSTAACAARGDFLHEEWDRYDTRHAVYYRPARLTPEALKAGYWHAYESFYRWGSILRGAATKPSWKQRSWARGLRRWMRRSWSRCGTS